MTNAEVRDAFAAIYKRLVTNDLNYKVGAQANAALNGILTSARLELEAYKLSTQAPVGFWNGSGMPTAASLSNEQLGARVRSIASKAE